MKKKIQKAYKLRIYPNAEQSSILSQCFGNARWLWNQCLNLEETRRQNGAGFLSQYSLNYILTQLKREYPWLKDGESTSLINTNAHLADAFKRYFKGQSRKPKYKSRKNKQSITLNCVNSNIIIVDHLLHIPKIGTMPFKAGQIPSGKIKSATITLLPSGKYTASVLCETEVEGLPKKGKSVGIDLGLKNFAILSDETKYPLIRFDKESEKRLHYWQRIAVRRLLKAKAAIKQDDSLSLKDFRNYQKAQQMCAKIQEHITNQRMDYLNKLSSEIIRRYDVIAIEDLRIKGMMKNHHLARAVGNAGWYMFRQMLIYKAAWYGKTVIVVNPKYTSQTCSECGCVNNRLGLSPYQWLKVREWDCSVCGTHHDRDINAAVNILNAAVA